MAQDTNGTVTPEPRPRYEAPLSDEAIGLIEDIKRACEGGPLVKVEIFLDRSSHEKVLVQSFMLEGALDVEKLAARISKSLDANVRRYSKEQNYRVLFLTTDGSVLGAYLSTKQSEMGIIGRAPGANQFDVHMAMAEFAGTLAKQNVNLVDSSQRSFKILFDEMRFQISELRAENAILKLRESDVIRNFAKLLEEQVDVELKRVRGRMLLEGEQYIMSKGAEMLPSLIQHAIEKWTGKPVQSPILKSVISFKESLSKEQLEGLHAFLNDDQRQKFGTFLKQVESMGVPIPPGLPDPQLNREPESEPEK